MEIDAKRIAFGAVLVGAGYAVGATAPTANAYTQDDNRLLNRISTDLGEINRSLQTIARKIK